MASLSPEEKQRYTDLYKEVDKEFGKGKGALNVAEFEKLLVKCGLHCPRFLVADMFAQWDLNEDWRISLEEFLGEMDKMLNKPSNTDLLGMIRRKFLKSDLSKDGLLNFEELKGLISDTFPDYDEAQLRGFFDNFDKDHDGKITFGEFIPMYIDELRPDSSDDEDANRLAALTPGEDRFPLLDGQSRSDLLKSTLHRKFEESDLDKDGFLTLAEVKGLITENYPGLDEDQVKEFFDSWDDDEDGRINFEEFIPMFIHTMWDDSEAEEEEVRRLEEEKKKADK